MKPELLDLTKRSLLKYLSEEEIFTKYLGFIPDLRSLYCNPLREDKTPGCSFYYRDSDGKLIFHDFAWGVHWDCFDVVQYDYNCNFPKALEKIANDFGLLNSKLVFTKKLPTLLPKNKIGNKIEIKRKKQFTSKELEFWNIGGLEITQEDLEHNKIYSISHLWEHTYTKINYYHRLDMTFAYKFGAYLYQIYSPLKKRENGERRFINPHKIKWGDLEFLNYEESYVIVTKSKKDAFFLRMLGLNVFFIINEAINLEDEALEALNKFETKFTLFDNDRAGVKASARFRRNYETIPLKYSHEEGKDTYAVLKKYGKFYMLDLIEHYKNYFEI